MSTGASAKIEVTYQPSGKTVRVPGGTTLFNAAHWAGLPIASTCGGRGTCGKCSVQILEGESELSLADYRHLADQLEDGWRLSCQCPINGPMTVDVPRLMKMPKAATMGVGRFVLLEPNVVKLFLELVGEMPVVGQRQLGLALEDLDAALPTGAASAAGRFDRQPGPVCGVEQGRPARHANGLAARQVGDLDLRAGAGTHQTDAASSSAR